MSNKYLDHLIRVVKMLEAMTPEQRDKWEQHMMRTLPTSEESQQYAALEKYILGNDDED